MNEILDTVALVLVLIGIEFPGMHQYTFGM